jgi:phage/plasmid-like protein (TIGR03299 family)
MTAEVESMFSLKEVPWHGLGRILDNPPTTEEAIRCAGLDWEVKLVPLTAKLDGEELQDIDRWATVRATDRKVLGTVGGTYRPLQNVDAFKFFQPALDAGEAHLETAGSLREGRRVWVLARLKQDPIEIVPGDAVMSYILLSNGHDGSMAVRAGFSSIRVVCANTLAAAHEGQASKLLRVRHTENTAKTLDEVRDIMDLGRREFVASTEKMRALARKGVNVEDLKEYVRLVFQPKVTMTTETEQKAKCDRLMGKIIPLFEVGRGNDMPGVKGTMWAAYNAVNEYLGWERGRNDTRLDSLWFGDGANVNRRAFDLALQVAVG